MVVGPHSSTHTRLLIPYPKPKTQNPRSLSLTLATPLSSWQTHHFAAFHFNFHAEIPQSYPPPTIILLVCLRKYLIQFGEESGGARGGRHGYDGGGQVRALLPRLGFLLSPSLCAQHCPFPCQVCNPQFPLHCRGILTSMPLEMIGRSCSHYRCFFFIILLGNGGCS